MAFSFTEGSSPFSNVPRYPKEAWYCLAIFLGILGIFHWSFVLFSKFIGHRRLQESVDSSSTHTLAIRPAGWTFTRLSLAAVNVFRVVAFRWTLKFGTYVLRAVDIFLILVYIAFLLAWTFVGDDRLQITKENIGLWSARAAVMAASQFPLVTALGTKNNLVSLVTGIGYDKLNFLHRVTARSCFGLLLIHVGGEIYSAFSIQILLRTTWLRLGITALASFTILLVVSLRVIRTRAYEVFFYTHFFTVFVLLLGAYIHTRAHGFQFWILPCLLIWALDRFMRVARTVAYNHLYCGFGRRARMQDATTELLSDDLVRVRVRRPPHFRWTPGQTAYLTVPSVSTFPLEAHPFTISSVDSVLFQPNTDEAGESVRWKELVFLIHVRNGFTERLKDAATQNQSVKLFIDGPYGCAPDMATYDTAIFIAGGSGITYTLPVFLSLIETARQKMSRCYRVVFVWAVRDASNVEWISDALVQANALAPSQLAVLIRIFATRMNERNSIDLERVIDKRRQEWIMPSVQLEHERPDLKAILQEEVKAATGSMGVTVCGSPGLTESVRRALRFPVSGPSSLLNGGPSVTLHVESFGYA